MATRSNRRPCVWCVADHSDAYGGERTDPTSIWFTANRGTLRLCDPCGETLWRQKCNAAKNK